MTEQEIQAFNIVTQAAQSAKLSAQEHQVVAQSLQLIKTSLTKQAEKPTEN